MPATEDVQRQEAIVIVITVEEAPFLVTVRKRLMNPALDHRWPMCFGLMFTGSSASIASTLSANGNCV